MVLIFKKQKGKLISLVFLHKHPLFTFIEKHVRRIGLDDKPNTCFVTQINNWQGYPRDVEAMELLNKIIQSENIREGFDLKYPVKKYLEPHQAFREFDGNNVPLNPQTRDGMFKVTITKVDPGAKAVLKAFDTKENNQKGLIEGIRNSFEERKIKNTFDKLNRDIDSGKADKAVVYIIEHIHLIT